MVVAGCGSYASPRTLTQRLSGARTDNALYHHHDDLSNNRSARRGPNVVGRCASEAQTAFGDPSVFVEAYVERARHIEVQVLGDAGGTIMAIGDRDCSAQVCGPRRRTGRRRSHLPAWSPRAC